MADNTDDVIKELMDLIVRWAHSHTYSDDDDGFAYTSGYDAAKYSCADELDEIATRWVNSRAS